MIKPKFKKGNLVRISDHLGKSMFHFRSGCDAIIIESTLTQDKWKYGVIFPDTGEECWWYYEHQLSFVANGGNNLIKKAEKRYETITKEEREDIENIDYKNSKKKYPETVEKFEQMERAMRCQMVNHLAVYFRGRTEQESME